MSTPICNRCGKIPVVAGEDILHQAWCPTLTIEERRLRRWAHVEASVQVAVRAICVLVPASQKGQVAMSQYIPCSESDIPDWVRFDITPESAANVVQIAYASGHRGSVYVADIGDRYKRRHDQGDGTTTYYRLGGK